jgi:hypothetical protein
MTIDGIVEQMLDTSHKQSFVCAQEITDILHARLPIIACTFYSYFENTGYLSLRSQTGFKYSDYKSFELPLDTIAGQAITRGKIVECESLLKNKHFRDQNLVTTYSLKRMYAIPLPAKDCLESLSGKLCQSHLGVLCIYPNNEIDSKTLEDLSRLVGKVYAYSVTQDRISIRKDIANTSLRVKDLNSFLYKVLQILSGTWGIEAASVFIHDARNDLLFLRATTGVTTDLKREQQQYSRDEVRYRTVKCFNTEEIITIADGSFNDHKYPEHVSGSLKSSMYLPIYEPTGTGINGENHIAGVLRCVNRVVQRDGIREVCHHGWEDASLMLFVSEIIGIISHLFKRNDEISLNFERAMHGIKKPIRAAKVHLKSTVQFMTATELLKPPFDNFLKDSISYLDALEWQVQKHTVRDGYTKISTSRINLFGDVLSKILSFIDGIYKTYNVKKLIRNRIDYSGMPAIVGNEKELQIVFRNIVENAMKYTLPSKECRIHFSWRQDDSYLYVSIEDFGIGIYQNDSKRIFDEGYRSIEAKRIEPTGTGIGLSDSREMMREMEGDIILGSFMNPTVFVVKMKKFLGG